MSRPIFSKPSAISVNAGYSSRGLFPSRSEGAIRQRSICSLAAIVTAFVLGGCGGGDDGQHADGTSASVRPLALALHGSSASTVSLAWAQVQGVTGYTLQRRGSTGDFQHVAELLPEVRQYVDDGLQAHTSYTYRLIAHQGHDGVNVEGSTTTTDDIPEVSAVGTVLGVTGRAVIGAAGGQLASADGSVGVDVPGGAWATDAPVVLQAQENTAPGGTEQALRLALPAAPAKPLTLSLAYGEDYAASADGLGVALQRHDGSWLSLPLKSVDQQARRITVELPVGMPSDIAQPQSKRPLASSAEVGIEITVAKYQRLYLSPKNARVQAGDTQRLVPYERTVTEEREEDYCEEGLDFCLPMLPIVREHQAPFLNSKPGYTRQWLVQGVPGGNSSLGTVQPQGNIGAIYTAPSQVPSPNPVAVSFHSKNDKTGRAINLQAQITVVNPVWTGIVHGVLDGATDLGFSFSAEAVWTMDPASADAFHANGTQTIHVTSITCSGSASPSSVPLPSGLLKIDRSTTPAHYALDVGSLWNTVISGSCPRGSTSVGMVVPGRLQTEGTVNTDGTRIEGAAHLNNIQWDWSLTSQLQP